MKVIITGGGGFLGSELAEALLARGELTGASGNTEPIEELVLLDARFGVGPTAAPARRMEGDITEQAVIKEAIGGAASFPFSISPPWSAVNARAAMTMRCG